MSEIFGEPVVVNDNKNNITAVNSDREIWGNPQVLQSNEGFWQPQEAIDSFTRTVQNIRSGIQKFLEVNPHPHDYIRLLAVKHYGSDNSENVWKIYKQLGATPDYFGEIVGSVFNGMGLPINEDIIYPEKGVGRFAIEGLTGLGNLAGFIAADMLVGGSLSTVGKLFEAGNKFINLSNKLVSLKKYASAIAENRMGAKVISALSGSLRLGLTTTLANILKVSPYANNVYGIVKDMEPELLSNMFMGAGFPLMRTTETVLGRLLLSQALGNTASFLATGGKTFDVKQLALGIYHMDAQEFFNGLFDSLLNAYFGFAAGSEKVQIEPEDFNRSEGDLLNVAKDIEDTFSLNRDFLRPFSIINPYVLQAVNKEQFKNMFVQGIDLSELKVKPEQMQKIADNVIKLDNYLDNLDVSNFIKALKISHSIDLEQLKSNWEALNDKLNSHLQVFNVIPELKVNSPYIEYKDGQLQITQEGLNKILQESGIKLEDLEKGKTTGVLPKEFIQSFSKLVHKEINNVQFKDVVFEKPDTKIYRSGFVGFKSEKLKNYVVTTLGDYLIFENRKPANEQNVTALGRVLGDKANVISKINEHFNDTIGKVWDKINEIYDPYGGGLVYHLNLDLLKETDKPIYINVSSKYEPELAWLYSEIKKGNKDVIDEYKRVLNEIFHIGKDEGWNDFKPVKLYLDKNIKNEQLKKAIIKVLNPQGKRVGYKKILTIIRNFDYAVKLLQRPNVHLVDKVDTEFFDDVLNASKNKKVLLLDDSDYTQLPFEKTKSVYGNNDIRALKLIANKQPIYHELYTNGSYIYAQNNVHPELINWLLNNDVGANVQSYSHSSQGGQIAINENKTTRQRLSGARAEYMAAIGRDIPKNYVKIEDVFPDKVLYGGIPLDAAINSLKKIALQVVNKLTTNVDVKDLNILQYLLFDPFHAQYLVDDPKLKDVFRVLNIIMDTQKQAVVKLKNTFEKLFEPLDSAYKVMDKNTWKYVKQAILEGDKENKDFLEVFKSYKLLNLSPEQRRAAEGYLNSFKKFYEGSRNIYNTLVEHKVSELQKLGIDPQRLEWFKQTMYTELGKIENYMPRIRDKANLVANVYRNGKLVHSETFSDPIAYFSDRSIVGKYIEKRLRKQFGKDVDIRITRPKEQLQVSKFDIFNVLDAISKVIDDVDITDTQKKQFMDEMIDNLRAQGFLAHAIHRGKNYVTGFIDDPHEATIKYMASLSSWHAKDLVKEPLLELYSSIPSSMKRTKKAVDNVIKEMLRNKDVHDKFTSYVRSFLFLKYIALSLRNLFVNVVFQVPMTAMHLHADLLEKGLHDAEAFVKTPASMTKALADVLLKNYNDKERKIMNKLDGLGVTKDPRTAYMMANTLLRTKAWNKAMQMAGFFMSKSEELNRKSAVLVYFRNHPELLDEPDKALQMATNFVYLTNGKYGDTNLSFAFQGESVAKRYLRIGQTFQTYNHQMLLGMYKLFKENQYTSLLLGLGTIAVLGGMETMPFYTTARNIYTQLTGKSLDVDVAKHLIKNEWLAGLIKDGVIEKILGIDVSASVQISMPTDDLMFKGGNWREMLMNLMFGVANYAIDDEIKGAQKILGGDYIGGLGHIIPVAFLSYPLKAMSDYKMGFRTDGGLQLIDPVTMQPLKPTLKESILEAMGFTPDRISEYKNLYYTYKTVNEYWSKQKQILYQKYRAAIQEGDYNKLEKVTNDIIKMQQKIANLNSQGYFIQQPSVNKIQDIYNNVHLLNFLWYNMGGGKKWQ